MKVANMVDLVGKVSSSRLKVTQERCVLVRNRNADCLRCAEACTSGCITYTDNELSIMPLSCIGCGTCSAACPTAALESTSPTDSDLIAACKQAAAANDGVCVVVCESLLEKAKGAIDPDKVVVVPCFGRFEESILLDLAADGVARVQFADMLCEGCEHGKGRSMLETVVASARELLGIWHSDMEVRITAKLPKSVRNEGKRLEDRRRSALSSAKDQALGVAALVAQTEVDEKLGRDQQKRKGPTYVHVNKSGALPYHMPDKRTRLVDALGRLGNPEDVMFESHLWGHIVIDMDKCRSCYMCATFCPTGALRKIADENGIGHGLEHYARRCVKCRTCQNICLGKAMVVSEEVFAVDMMDDLVEIFELKSQTLARSNKFGRF